VRRLATGYTQADIASIRCDKNHVYWAKLTNGKSLRFKGVTGTLSIIAKPALIRWAAKMAGEYMKEHLPIGEPLDEVRKGLLIENAVKHHDRTKDDAGSFGTIAHGFIERWGAAEDIEVELANADPKVQNSVQLFFEWFAQNKLKIVARELLVYDASLGLAGQADMICEDEAGGLILVDFKTGSGIYSEAVLQVLAYVHCCHVCGYPVNGAMILRIGKNDAHFEIVNVPQEAWAPGFVAFLNAMALSRMVDGESGLIPKFLKGKEVEW
jgi:hypothetical protein